MTPDSSSPLNTYNPKTSPQQPPLIPSTSSHSNPIPPTTKKIAFFLAESSLLPKDLQPPSFNRSPAPTLKELDNLKVSPLLISKL